MKKLLKTSTVLLSGGILAVAGLVAMLAFSNPLSGGYKVGDVAADFKLKNAIDNEWVSLASYSNAKGYIVVFTCNTCPYAVMYEDRLIALHNTYAPQGFPVVAINPNDPGVQPGDSYDLMKKRAEEKKFPFKYLFDEGQKVYPQYGATRTPHIFLLDSDRVVRYIGAIDNNAQDASAATQHYLSDAIEAIKKGDEPDPTFTRAVGCTIKVRT